MKGMANMNKVILASQSPRRKELLEKIGDVDDKELLFDLINAVYNDLFLN